MNERANTLSFIKGALVLLSTVNLPRHVVTNVGISKLMFKFIIPFRVLRRQGNAYTIELPRRMRTHLRFTWGASARTFSTSLLLTVKITPTLKDLHQVLALAL